MEEAILYQLHSLLAATALGFCRLAPTFYLLPFFASGNIPTVVRHPIIIVVSCALFQHYHYELSTLNEIDIALFAAREIIIGLFIACLLSSPFWIFLAIGSFIDNQRGATLSSTLDPATGVDTSELARLFNLFSAAVYLTNGGLNFILETLWQSYNLWPSGNFNLKPGDKYCCEHANQQKRNDRFQPTNPHSFKIVPNIWFSVMIKDVFKNRHNVMHIKNISEI